MSFLDAYFNAQIDEDNHFFFSTVNKEAEQVIQKQLCISPLFNVGLIKVSGVNAKTFLQGQLSCDVNTIDANQNSFGAYCTVQGRIQSFFTLCMYDNDYFLSLPLSMLPITLTELRKYAVFSKVNIDDVTNTYKILGVYGDKTKVVSFFEQAQLPLPEKNFLSTISISNKENGIKINRLYSSDETILAQLIIPQSATEIMWQKFLDHHAAPIGDNAWQLVLIEQGIPSIDEKLTALFLPHNLNLPELNAVNFKKGCYRGQEIVARMQYLGKIKKHLYRVTVMSNFMPENGSACASADEKEIGQIINSAWLSTGKLLCLVMLQDEAMENQLTIKILPKK